MPKVHEAVFAQDPQTFGDVFTAAGAVDGSDAVELYTAGTEGCLISRLSVGPIGTVTATGVTFYVQKAGSSVKVPRISVTVSAYTEEATAALPIEEVDSVSEATPLRLGRGDKLFAATHVANSSGIAIGGEAQEFYDVGGV